MHDLFNPWIIGTGIFAWLSNSFPSWWPLLVKDKTIPEWFKARFPNINDQTSILIAPAISLTGLVALIGVLFWKLPSTEVKQQSSGSGQLPPSLRLVHSNDLVLPIASAELLSSNEIQGKAVFINELPHSQVYLRIGGPPTFKVTNKKFINCDIFGPAVIAFGGEFGEISQCQIVTRPGTTIESHLMTVNSQLIAAALPLDNCVFERCRFFNIAFAGDPNQIEQYRKGFTQKPQ